MGLYSWINCIRTIQACGDTVPQHAIDRVMAHGELIATGLVQYEETGTFPEPGYLGADKIEDNADDLGGTMYLLGWYGVEKFNPAPVISTLRAKPAYRDAAPAGALHVCGDAFANGG
jgi:hypothetical protein